MTSWRRERRERHRRPASELYLALLIALWIGGSSGARLPRVSSGPPLARDVSHVAALAVPALASAHLTVRSSVPRLVRADHAGLPRAVTLLAGLVPAARTVNRARRPQRGSGNLHPPSPRAPPAPAG